MWFVAGDEEPSLIGTGATVLRRDNHPCFTLDRYGKAELFRVAARGGTAPRPLRVGSRIAFVPRFLGRRLAYTYQVQEFVPGERLVMLTAEGPFPMETTYVWESTPEEGTRMTLRNRGRPAGFSAFLAPFVAMAMRRANRKDLARLKTILEGPG